MSHYDQCGLCKCAFTVLFVFGCSRPNNIDTISQTSPGSSISQNSSSIVVTKEEKKIEPFDPLERNSVDPSKWEKTCKAKSPQVVVWKNLQNSKNDQLNRWLVIAKSRTHSSVVVLRNASGEAMVKHQREGGGPPYWWIIETINNRSNIEQIAIGDSSGMIHCEPALGEIIRSSQWNDSLEDYYSAWVENLFDGSGNQELSWNAMHEVTRDRDRNFLHNSLGMKEDDPSGWRLIPDCADFPYFLRAYFSIKMKLPFAFSSCSRGSSSQPPECNDREFIRWNGKNSKSSLKTFFQKDLADGVHSGNARAKHNGNRSDFYPIDLSWGSLRPGSIFADPYGHVLVLVKKIPQTETESGILLAADGQPDGTISRKKFWKGHFLFDLDPILGSPGWKRFRPIEWKNENLKVLSNDEIPSNDYSEQQYQMKVDDFYDKMDSILTPKPIPLEQGLTEAVSLLEEQVRMRIKSVNNAEKINHQKTIEMPNGYSIFETEGPWEDFSTPSRDMRLLIAIDVVQHFIDKVRRHPERFIFGNSDNNQLESFINSKRKEELENRWVEYKRSNGTDQRLRLQDIVDRSLHLEVAYNPNDCPEIRWGANEGTEEISTCRRRAPSDQKSKMQKYRHFFHERKRPARK